MGRSTLKNVFRLIEAAKETLPPEKSFLQDLKRSIEMDADKNKRLPSKSYKPSSMNCIRNMFYQVVGKEPDVSGSSYLLEGICNAGTDVHERLQGYITGMQANGMPCEYVDVATFVKSRKIKNLQIKSKQGMETKLFHKSLNMSFLSDGIIKYDGKYYILEIKSETASKWYNRNGVDPSHYNQATAYSVAFGLKDVIFLYVNRDMVDMKTFLFTVTDDMKQELIGKIEGCDGYVQRLVTPPKPKDLDRKTCEYCSYKTQCRKEGN